LEVFFDTIQVMRIRKKYQMITAALVVVVAVGVGTFWFLSAAHIPKNYVLVKSYAQPKTGDLECAAASPGCGVCDNGSGGKVIKGKCYVPKGSSFDGL
jgi:hypothetical protein